MVSGLAGEKLRPTVGATSALTTSDVVSAGTAVCAVSCGTGAGVDAGVSQGGLAGTAGSSAGGCSSTCASSSFRISSSTTRSTVPSLARDSLSRTRALCRRRARCSATASASIVNSDALMRNNAAPDTGCTAVCRDAVLRRWHQQEGNNRQAPQTSCFRLCCVYAIQVTPFFSFSRSLFTL